MPDFFNSAIAKIRSDLTLLKNKMIKNNNLKNQINIQNQTISQQNNQISQMFNSQNEINQATQLPQINTNNNLNIMQQNNVTPNFLNTQNISNINQNGQALNKLTLEFQNINFKNMSPKNCFLKIKEAATLLGDKHPEITAAQFCLESGFGKHTSGKNNFFGVKGNSSNGKSCSTTEEINGKLVRMNQTFKNYNSPLDSIKDHINLKMTSKYYKGYSTASNTQQALSCLKSYATNSDYLTNINKMIRLYDNGIQSNNLMVQLQNNKNSNSKSNNQNKVNVKL